MDYEEKYKDVLERARGLHEQGMMTERIEYIFPELKESEDERIRKALIEHIDCKNKELHIDSNNSVTVADAIVWLEKQGRQKPTWSEEDENGFGDALWAIRQARTIVKNENEMGNLWYAEKWLKSLKERMKGE